MSKRLAYERYIWFHQQMKRDKYPTLEKLRDKFEISERQSQREIDNMRTFFSAPIEYCRDHKGYYYTDQKYELPPLWVHEEELVSLIIAQRLFVTIPNRERKNKLKELYNNIFDGTDFNISELEKKISLKNIRYYKVKPQIFDSVLFALNKERKIGILYRSVFAKKMYRRIIHPYHLMLYMGNWHLIAYCEKRKDMRNFTLSRIKEADILEEKISYDSEIINNISRKSFGIFSGKKLKKVVLRFKKEISEFIEEQVWFDEQNIQHLKDNSILLAFPVSDYREIIKEILRYGSLVEVLKPADLREMVKKEIIKMGKIY